MTDIIYKTEPDLSADEFIDVLVRSTLAERRPVHDRAVIEGMLRKADVIVTARVEGLLVGVSRAITDFNFCTYLADLAVEIERRPSVVKRKKVRALTDSRRDPSFGVPGEGGHGCRGGTEVH